ncbi:predicted protein [Postia placenta Mad-698-R]|uniref:DUF4470 domain-containing protein n=1 Tax=Postia placenta MAD-698-R-SB12 TaxID=670580 RepID=A0A1X6N3C4_9APHY|nr:hypothetical protein POSPLADRAFT_1046416 [Postia placenta MAD-698-R-SB12]EED84255.1 predicted protein [Postia placenta Mad-698-R]OSX63105.1 hypothetical protein POSPLADRAFT_1046416 [Postia placenta MAD-698-R-SB12]
MAHPLVYPGKYFFYPLGNTPAVCLTRDIPPEEPADVLLLGCGDPRSVLFTIFSEPRKGRRALDFTCCDFEPAVLARNVLLLTLVADKQLYTSSIWNIFFHIYIDEASREVLVDQCKKLIQLSDSLNSWMQSPYGQFIGMSTEYTLSELRRHWTLYADMPNLPSSRVKPIRDKFTQIAKSQAQRLGQNVSTARGAGPLMFKAVDVTSRQYNSYWKTGTTFSDQSLIKAAKFFNPTFAYSFAGEGCAVHYGTDPMESFHLVALFGNAWGSITVSDVVKAAKAEFSDWCTAFSSAVSDSSRVLTVRFFLAEAMAACRALHDFVETGTLETTVPVAQWKTQLILFNQVEYVSRAAPARFNVIDTSNLDDHIGLLNVVIAATPLLAPPPRPIALYTESLLVRGEDATKEFAQRLYANLTVMSLLLGVTPIDYISGFSSRSNTHELMLYVLLKETSTQFQQVTTWKRPVSGDAYAFRGGGGCLPPTFDSIQLGTLLYDIYHDLFEQEDARHFWRLNQGNVMNAISKSNIIHYTRESFVLFLKLVRDRLFISREKWLEVMDRFMDLQSEDQTLRMDSCNLQDFHAHLHRHGMYTLPFMLDEAPRVGRFADWRSVTALVRVILVIPREKLSVLHDVSDKLGTPLLQCDIRGEWSHNIFSSVHVAFGRAIPMGTKARPWVTFEADSEGWSGTSSLVASFTMASRYLTDIEPPHQLRVTISVRSTPASSLLTEKLGIMLIIHEARLMDESAVFVLPEHPLPARNQAGASDIPQSPDVTVLEELGRSNRVVVGLDEQCALPTVKQVSPSTMRLILDGRVQDVMYPFPVIGGQNKLRLARKSLYIEVVVPVYGPFQPEGMKLNPFTVAAIQGTLDLWSIHRLNLSTLPVLDTKASKLADWLNPHIGSMMSKRERSLRKKHKEDILMYVKDTIHAILVRASGIQEGPPCRLFALRDHTTKNSDTVIFVDNIKYDMHCHTVVCDGFVLPLTSHLLRRLEQPFCNLITPGRMVDVAVFGEEMRAWKQLFPALAERCRTSWTHGPNCEYRSQGQIPLTEEMELDPLCSCGRGRDTEAMQAVDVWRPFAPHVTRIAISPLFAVSYLETIGRDPDAHRCFVCRGKGKPKIRACSGCKKKYYTA